MLAGNIYENKQDWDRARQMYEKALTMQPDNPMASNNLAYVMLQQGGNVDVAFAMAQTARRLAGLLGGEISAASDWTKGSEFTVTFPSPARSAA